MTYITKIAMVIIIVSSIFSYACLSGNVAYATEFGGSGYANELITGDSNDRGGWDEHIFQDATGDSVHVSDDASSTQSDFVNRWNNISNTMSALVWFVAVWVTVLRFVGRAVFEMSFRQSKKQSVDKVPSLILTFIATGEERKGSHDGNAFSSEWLWPMTKETVIFFFLVLGIWLVFGVLAGIVRYALVSGFVGSATQAGISFG